MTDASLKKVIAFKYFAGYDMGVATLQNLHGVIYYNIQRERKKR